MQNQDIRWIQGFANFCKVGKVYDELDDLMLPYSFDLSVFSHIGNSDFVAHIERAGVVFYERGEG